MEGKGFTKSERIVSKKLIDEIFSGKSSLSKVAFPLRIVLMQRQRPEGEAAAQILISVSKRHFKHAVDRNRVKRQLREAYRQNRDLFINRIPTGQQLCLVFIWLSDRLVPTEIVSSRMRHLLKKITFQESAS